MSMFRIFDVAGSAVSAQSQRLNVVASNLANADTVAGPDGQAYKARQVVFTTTPMGEVGTGFPKRNARQRIEIAAPRALRKTRRADRTTCARLPSSRVVVATRRQRLAVVRR